MSEITIMMSFPMKGKTREQIDEEMANIGLTLCHMTDKMMTSFLQKLEKDFIENGGIKEMTFDELEQIYMIMGIHSILGKEGVDTFIENNS